MTDDPFKDRPEDVLNRSLKAAVGALPVVGGPLAEFFHFAIVDPAQERRDDFIRDAVRRLVNLEGDYNQLSKEALRDNAQFQATIVQAVRIASATASDKKLEMLKNAILNSAIAAPEETLRHVFMQIIDEVTASHAVLLAFLENPKANARAVQKAKSLMAGSFSHVLEEALPELTSQKVVYERVVSDLHRLGLADTASFMGMITGGEQMLHRRTTEIGSQFLKFITPPE